MCLAQAEWHSCIVAVKMLKRSDEIAMNDFRTELDVLQKVRLTNMLDACQPTLAAANSVLHQNLAFSISSRHAGCVVGL